jgi:hypothetical protein
VRSPVQFPAPAQFPAFALAACLSATDAAAGAWTLAEGDAQVISTAGRNIAPIGAFIDGAADTDSNSTQLWVEYGLAEGWTVGALVYAEFSTTDASDMQLRLGAHVRRRIWTGAQGGVAAIQAGFSAPVESWMGELAPDSLPDSVPEISLSALYGRGWQTGWGNSFVSTGAGLQWRGEGADEELRFEVTAGHEAWKGVLGLFSVFSSVPLGDRNDATLKLAPSIAYTLWPWLGENDRKPYDPPHPDTVQLGIVWDTLNQDDGLGVQLSIWKTF